MELYSYSKFNIYKNYSRQMHLHKPTISFWFTGTHTPSPKPMPLWQPQEGDHIKGTFKETVLLTVPTIPGPREGPANPNKYNCCVSGFPGPVLRIIGWFLENIPVGGEMVTDALGQWGYTIATQTAEPS